MWFKKEDQDGITVLRIIQERLDSSISADLKTELLRAIENGHERFQIAVTTGGLPPCDNDGIADLWLYNVNDISLIVTYRP